MHNLFKGIMLFKISDINFSAYRGKGKTESEIILKEVY